jgi:hypothetical protein
MMDNRFTDTATAAGDQNSLAFEVGIDRTFNLCHGWFLCSPGLLLPVSSGMLLKYSAVLIAHAGF